MTCRTLEAENPEPFLNQASALETLSPINPTPFSNVRPAQTLFLQARCLETPQKKGTQNTSLRIAHTPAWRCSQTSRQGPHVLHIYIYIYSGYYTCTHVCMAAGIPSRLCHQSGPTDNAKVQTKPVQSNRDSEKNGDISSSL